MSLLEDGYLEMCIGTLMHTLTIIPDYRRYDEVGRFYASVADQQFPLNQFRQVEQLFGELFSVYPSSFLEKKLKNASRAYRELHQERTVTLRELVQIGRENAQYRAREKVTELQDYYEQLR
ncbi:MAG: hypothetical protein V1725_03210 [archaeon]